MWSTPHSELWPGCVWCCTDTECWDKRDVKFICYLYSSSYSVLLKQLLICFTQQPDDHWRAGHRKVSCHPHHAVSGLSVLDNFCNERFQAIFPSSWIKCPWALITWAVKAVSLHLMRQHRVLFPTSPQETYLVQVSQASHVSGDFCFSAPQLAGICLSKRMSAAIKTEKSVKISDLAEVLLDWFPDHKRQPAAKPLQHSKSIFTQADTTRLTDVSHIA